MWHPESKAGINTTIIPTERPTTETVGLCTGAW